MPNVGVRQKLFCIFVIFKRNSSCREFKFHQIYLQFHRYTLYILYIVFSRQDIFLKIFSYVQKFYIK